VVGGVGGWGCERGVGCRGGGIGCGWVGGGGGGGSGGGVLDAPFEEVGHVAVHCRGLRGVVEGV